MSPPSELPTATRPYIGGQAVLEGVMMRSPTSFAIVVRRRDGSLHVRERPMVSDRRGARGWPFVRGVMSLVESLKLGSESLGFSAEQYEKDLLLAEAEEKKKAPLASKVVQTLALLTSGLLRAGDDPVGAPAAVDPAAKKKSNASLWVSVGVMLLVMWALPQAFAEGLKRIGHWEWEVTSPQFQAVTGVFKLTIVIGYMLLIRRIKDIRRVFQYHGAEHKTISTYEANLPLTVDNARQKTTLHPRCGTTFLVMVALMSVIIFSIVGAFIPRIHTGNAILDNVIFFVIKIPFIPVIASITFELQRILARYCATGPLRIFLMPGFAVQKITTIEPDDSQLEVALAALRVTLFREQGENSAKKEDVRFGSYRELLEAPHLRTS